MKITVQLITMEIFHSGGPPHPVIVSIRDNQDYIRVLLYSYCTTIKGWGSVTIRDNKDYMWVLLYSYCTTIKGWGGQWIIRIICGSSYIPIVPLLKGGGVLLGTTNSNRPAKAGACAGFMGIVSLEACKDQSSQGHGRNPGTSAVDCKYKKKKKLSKQEPVTLSGPTIRNPKDCRFLVLSCTKSRASGI